MPTNTDLVTDLPADFAVFGQGVDTTMAGLKGGTTGQILSKTSATDMAFTWITNDVGDITAVTVSSPITGGGTSGSVNIAIQDASTAQKGSVQLSDSTSTTSSILASTPTATKAAYDLANTANTTANAAVAKSTVTAKGSIFTATASATPAEITAGANGTTLVADSSTSTGLRYQATQAAGKNYIINGGMDVWQRGATGLGTSTGSYTADRWVLGSSSTTVTRDTDVPVSPYFQYSMKMVGTGTNSMIQKIESANSVLLAGQTITISFYAKRTSGAGALNLNLYYPTAVDNFTSVTQIGSAITMSASPSSSWVRYQTSVAIGTNITAGLQMLIDNTGASTTFITGVQIEIGSIATQFTRAAGNIQGELAACQRYYYRQTADGDVYQNFGFGMVTNTTTAARIQISNPVTMRAKPTSIDFATLRTADYGAGYAVSAITFGETGIYSNWLTVTMAAGTAYRPVALTANNSSSAYIGVSAEL